VLYDLLTFLIDDQAAELAPIPSTEFHQEIVDRWTGVRMLLLAETRRAQVGSWGYFVYDLPNYAEASRVVNSFGHLGILTTELGKDRPVLVPSVF
jgi:hypothetical protein